MATDHKHYPRLTVAAQTFEQLSPRQLLALQALLQATPPRTLPPPRPTPTDPNHPPRLTVPAPTFEQLSPRQLLALEALLQGKTRQEAAHLAGVDERTLRRWQHTPVFHISLAQARYDL